MEQNSFFSQNDYQRVILKDLIVEAHVGLHAWEKHPERPSRLVLNIELFAHLPKEKSAHAKESIIDYDHVRNELKSWAKRPHTPLLETLVEEVIAMCFKNEKVEACRVSVVKPDIFNEAAAAGIEFYRVRP